MPSDDNLSRTPQIDQLSQFFVSERKEAEGEEEEDEEDDEEVVDSEAEAARDATTVGARAHAADPDFEEGLRRLKEYRKKQGEKCEISCVHGRSCTRSLKTKKQTKYFHSVRAPICCCF